MVKSNVNALGIIFPNSYDNMVPELVTERLMASIPFAGRYRMIDFILSSMVSSGIDNISIIVRNNYHSLMDHLGSGREWDLTRKNGGLTIIPPFAEKTVKMYNGRVQALASILELLRDQKEEYVVMSGASVIWWSWQTPAPTMSGMPSGGMTICLLFRKAGCLRSRRTKHSSSRCCPLS